MNTNTKRITHYITALISVVVLVCIDQFTKYLVVGHLKDRPAYVLIRKNELRLSVKRSNLLYLESADNYVCIWYLNNGAAHEVYASQLLEGDRGKPR